MLPMIVIRRSLTHAAKREGRALSVVAGISPSSQSSKIHGGTTQLLPAKTLSPSFSVPEVGTTQKRTFFGSKKESPSISDEEVKKLFGLWNDALATLDADTVAQRYAKKSVLLPTVSDTPRTDYESIKAYFEDFLQKKPQGVILESNVIQEEDGGVLDAGIYEFTMGATGDKVKARYTYMYTFEDGEWKIAHHHSSVMPEGMLAAAAAAEPITTAEVQSLFGLWNDALATLDADTVAQRYSKDAVLLPTVSDLPRTDYAGIKDYFVNFLEKKPQGVILESNVIIGHNWAQDAGLYEFTMGATGDKVKARYSFIYVFEDGEWKISHHHSSVMPEAILG